jgi:restriction endonuclease
LDDRHSRIKAKFALIPFAALEREGMRQQVEAINKKFEGVFNNTEYSYIVLDELNKIGSSKLSNETASLLRVYKKQLTQNLNPSLIAPLVKKLLALFGANKT